MVVRSNPKEPLKMKVLSFGYKYTSTMFVIEVIELKKAPIWAFLF